jgi:hypothetical protein
MDYNPSLRWCRLEILEGVHAQIKVLPVRYCTAAALTAITNSFHNDRIYLQKHTADPSWGQILSDILFF